MAAFLHLGDGALTEPTLEPEVDIRLFLQWDIGGFNLGLKQF